MKKTADPAETLALGLQQLNIVQPGLHDALMAYLAELVKWNKAYNLTAVRDPQQMVIRHLLDSLAMLPALDALTPQSPLLDVGSGAGLPGLIIAMARPELEVHVIDSNGKKARFLRHVQRTLGLNKVEIFEGRVEQHGYQNAYAVVSSRAFTALDDFFHATAGLLLENGHWLAMKGRVNDNELAATPPTVSILRVLPLTVPGLDEDRHLVVAAPLPS